MTLGVSAPCCAVLCCDLLPLQIIECISDTFGRRIWRHTLLVLTHGNMGMPPPGTTFGEGKGGGCHEAVCGEGACGDGERKWREGRVRTRAGLPLGPWVKEEEEKGGGEINGGQGLDYTRQHGHAHQAPHSAPFGEHLRLTKPSHLSFVWLCRQSNTPGCCAPILQYWHSVCFRC
jgi:hypothetical protein